MGTNFEARIIPSKSRKEELKRLIDEDAPNVESEFNKTYGSFTVDYNGERSGNIVHLGKRSGGWKFLWNPNVYIVRHGHSEQINGSHIWIAEPDTLHFVYPLTKDGIKAFIDREDVEIYDEYGDKQNKEEFWEMALNWTTWDGKEAWDSESYEAWERQRNPSYKSFMTQSDLTKALEKLGFHFSTYYHDFYSDGLRFSSNTEFS